MHKLLGLVLFLNVLQAMERNSLEDALKAVEETKVQKYRATLAKKFTEIKRIDFENLRIKESNNELDSVIRLVCGDSDYAPLLKWLLESKKISPNFSWEAISNTYEGPFANRGNLLGLALINKVTDSAQLLVEHGADVNCVTVHNHRPLYPLNAAVELNAPVLVRTILARKPDISYTSSCAVTQFPLSCAIVTLCCRENRESKDERKKGLEIIGALLAYGCDPCQKQRSEYPTPIYLQTHYKWDLDTHRGVTTPLEIIKAYNGAFDRKFNDIEQLLMERVLKTP